MLKNDKLHHGNMSQEQSIEALKELLREEMLAGQGPWMVSKIAGKIPELYIECNDGGWTWTYRCLEQVTDSSVTPFDALLDFIASQLNSIEEF